MKKFLFLLVSLICVDIFASGCPDENYKTGVAYSDGVTVSDKFCVLKKAVPFSGAQAACQAIPAERTCHLARPDEICPPPGWNKHDIGLKCPKRHSIEAGSEGDSFVWIDLVYSSQEKELEDYEYEEPDENAEPEEPRAWHLLLREGNIYHYPQSWLSRPVCYCP